MTILLTTPKHEFTEAKIIQLRWMTTRKILFITFEFGDTVAGAWKPGDVQHIEKVIRNLEQILDGKGGEISSSNPVLDALIVSSLPLATFEDKSSDPSFAKIVVAHPTHGDLDLWIELAYSSTGRNLYQHAIDNDDWPEFEGTIL